MVSEYRTFPPWPCRMAGPRRFSYSICRTNRGGQSAARARALKDASSLTPEIGLCEIDDFVEPSAHDGFDHVEGETLRHLHRDGRRHCKLGADNHGVD